jgi:purine-binding chemotaxis protein CheW
MKPGTNRRDPPAIEALTFDLRGETFALEANLVREVLDLLPETDVPGAPPSSAP